MINLRHFTFTIYIDKIDFILNNTYLSFSPLINFTKIGREVDVVELLISKITAVVTMCTERDQIMDGN